MMEDITHPYTIRLVGLKRGVEKVLLEEEVQVKDRDEAREHAHIEWDALIDFMDDNHAWNRLDIFEGPT